jgi:hypothetical protein
MRSCLVRKVAGAACGKDRKVGAGAVVARRCTGAKEAQKASATLILMQKAWARSFEQRLVVRSAMHHCAGNDAVEELWDPSRFPKRLSSGSPEIDEILQLAAGAHLTSKGQPACRSQLVAKTKRPQGA